MDSEKLIEHVRAYKCLYDVNDKNYSDSQKKDAAWREISKKLFVKETLCKKGWALLRDSYRRAMKKAKESQAEQGNVIIKWRYADEMSFLLPYIKPRIKLNMVPPHEDPIQVEDAIKIEYSDESHFPDDVLQSNAENSPMSDSHQEILPHITTTTSAIPLRRKRRMLARKLRSGESNSTPLMKYTRTLENKRMDDIEQFFASIATTVQSFPIKDRAIAKAKVFQRISNMELEILNRFSTSD